MLTRVAAPALGPHLAAALRILIATLVLWGIMRAYRQPWPWQHWRELLALGFLGVAGPHVLYSYAALELPAGYGSLLSVSALMFSAMAAAWLQEERLTAVKVFACCLGFTGAACIVELGPVERTPALMGAALVCIAASALSGISTPYIKRATTRMEPLPMAAGMHAAAVVLMLPGALHDGPSAHPSPAALGAVALMGAVTSGLAYWIYIRIVQHIPPMAAQSATLMTTAFGVLWAVLFLHEPTGLLMLCGAALILISCLLIFGLYPQRWRGRWG